MATDITVGIILVIGQPHFKAIGPLNGPFSSPRGARNAISPPAIYMGPLTYYVLWMDNSDYLSQLLHQISPATHRTGGRSSFWGPTGKRTRERHNDV